MKLLKLAAVVNAAVLALVALLALFLWSCGPHQPSDAALEKQFSEHQQDLGRIVTMMDEDWQMSRIAPDFTWKQDDASWPRPESDWGISQQRWDDYRKIFAQAGCKDGTNRRGSDILILVWSRGVVPAGASVGYLHCEAPRNGYAHYEPACMENHESGSGFYGTSSSLGYRYKKIAADWYILEQSN